MGTIQNEPRRTQARSLPSKRRESPRLDAWRRSSRCKAVALQALDVARAVLSAKPKCGAKRKRDGQPCQQPALENKRCKFHGGATPRGAAWHRIKCRRRAKARGVEKFERKLEDQQKRKDRRYQRLAMMNPEQRAKHQAWQASHQPGPASGRAHRRQQLKTKAMLDGLLAAKEQLGQAIELDAGVDVFG